MNHKTDTVGIIQGSIACNGIKPTKTEVYTLAAEMAEKYDIITFKQAIHSALIHYDDADYYYDDYYDYYYYNDYYDYYTDYNDYYDYYDNHHFTPEEKVLALLFLAAMYS